MHTLVRYGSYPVGAVGALLLLTLAAMNGAGYWPTFPMVVLLGGALVAILERWYPYVPDWNRDQSCDTRVDALHFLVNFLLIQSSITAFYLLHDLVPDVWGIWPEQLAFPIQVLMAGLIVDVGLYAMHRLSHVHNFLWRLHAIHHQPVRLYWLNGSRRHPLSALLLAGPSLIVLAVLGASFQSVAVWMSFMSIHLAFQHANLDYRLGPLRLLLAVAETHRWHHKRDYEDAQVNFGEVFLIWDHLFGSFHDTSTRIGQGEVGVRGYTLPAGYWSQLKWPFR
jgi:sterol desaturase/sphingolipid hydroxylase (fatty acid hydroxylase superfamily)